MARFTAQRFRFPGVEIKARLFRSYPLGEVGSHLIGYIGRINQAEKKAMEDWDDETLANYRGTEYIGKLGLEQAYERELHGITGFEQVETSAGGRAVRRLSSRPPTPGNTCICRLTSGCRPWSRSSTRTGVAPSSPSTRATARCWPSSPSRPSTPTSSSMASMPSWRELNEDIDKPLLNRALRGTYPPGSTFKPFMSIAALNSGKRGPNRSSWTT